MYPSTTLKVLIKLLPSVPKQSVSIQVDNQAFGFSFFIKNISQLFALNQSVRFIINLRDTVVDWLRTLTIFSILIRRQFKCSNTGSRSDMLSYLRTTSIFTVGLHQANRDLYIWFRQTQWHAIIVFIQIENDFYACFYTWRNDWHSFSVNHHFTWVLEIIASLRTNFKKSLLRSIT